jgi:hypothetical protein
LLAVSEPHQHLQPSRVRSTHIFPAASTMVGVCMTVVSIVKVLHGKKYELAAIVSVASIIFLVSTFCAYVALRHEKPGRVDAVAEYLFLAGLVLMTLAGVLLAVEIV